MEAKANYVPIDQLPSYVGKKARCSRRRCRCKADRPNARTMLCRCYVWVGIGAA